MISGRRFPGLDLLERLAKGDLPAACWRPDGQVTTEVPLPAVLLPGAFNPIHGGHWKLAEIAGRTTTRPAEFELSIVNVDKPPLQIAEAAGRIEQFRQRAALWVTRAPTFVEKASLFPGTIFVVGADTAWRVLAPHYYGDDPDAMCKALEHIRNQGCRFLVAGRADDTGRFMHLEDLTVPGAFADLFTAIPRAEFEDPISSTALRNSGHFRS
jgi:hypothetical protein